MDKREALFNQIESYLNNNLTSDQREAFEREMASDSELRKEVQVQSDLQHAVEMHGVEKSIAEVDQAYHSKKGSGRFWMKIAAGIAVFVAVGIWAITRPSHTEKLFAKNLTQEPGLPVPMSSETSFEFYDAMVDFKMGKYELAIQKWSNIESTGRYADTLDYFIGVAHFELGDYQSAVKQLERVDSNAGKFANKAQWYTVLSSLQLEDFDRIREVQVDRGSPYADRIDEIRNALD